MFNLFQRSFFPIVCVALLLATYIAFDSVVVHCDLGNCKPIRPDIGLRTAIDPVKLNLEQLETLPQGSPLTEQVQSHLAERYSYRYLWTFLASAFFLLCIASIGFSIYTICDSVVKTNKWLIICTSISVVFVLIVSVWPESYMQVLMKMYDQTLFHSDGADLSKKIVSGLNAFGFAASIFLVAAVSAILFSVEHKTDEDRVVTTFQSTQVESEPSEEQTHAAGNASIHIAEKYGVQLGNLRIVLYLGGSLLLVAVLKLKVLSLWHQSFFGTDAGYLSKLLDHFFSSSLAFQAGFYTIMLAVLYLPAAFIIQVKAAELKKLGIMPTSEFAERGLSFSFWNFLPRLLTILSPFLAGTAVEGVKHLSAAFN